MSKKEEFKKFAATHPELVTHINKKEKTWQEFYEIYDIYGESPDAWQDYFKTSKPKTTAENKSTPTLSDVTNIFKKADMTSIQKHIGTAQRALGFFQELTANDAAAGLGAAGLAGLASKSPKSSRPLNKFFED